MSDRDNPIKREFVLTSKEWCDIVMEHVLNKHPEGCYSAKIEIEPKTNAMKIVLIGEPKGAAAPVATRQ